MAYNLDLTRFGIKLDFVDTNNETTSKTYNGFNIMSDGQSNPGVAAMQFGRFIHGYDNTFPGLVDFLFGRSLAGKTLIRQNAITGE